MAPPKRPSFRAKKMVKVINGRCCGEEMVQLMFSTAEVVLPSFS